MDVATQTHLTTLRNSLNYRLTELRAEVHARQMARSNASGTLAHEVTDRKDEAAQEQFADVDDAELQRDIDELARVESALRRLDAGTYGDCTDCGEAIPLQRLLVQPAAQRCAACQAAYERAHAD
jgi:RNA polymerase-binding protein DksA